MKNKLINIIMNTDLLLTKLSQEEWLLWKKRHFHKNIFFGVGLMTSKFLSEEVPFDILSMFFLSELLRRFLEADKVIVLVADQHALTNQLLSPQKIKERTTETILTIQSVIKGFNLTCFEIIQTTPLNFDERIKKIYRQLPHIPNDYLKHEIADTLWLNKYHNVGVKLGWSMSSEKNIQGHDERFFDTEIAKFCPSVSFIHSKPGRTTNVLRPRVSPYVSVAGEDRLFLKRGENAEEKITQWKKNKNNLTIKPFLRQVSQIQRLHDQLFKPLLFMSFEKKIQILIDKSLRDVII